ncbi:DUF927 domain-containing protein [Kitasatospora sp. NPDC001309]|uniref:DUF927 domain-containing protein n=1 Tax=Kitasatospora sp. NPDC001309 TaxID=3364013 RepID=UPI0036A05112
MPAKSQPTAGVVPRQGNVTQLRPDSGSDLPPGCRPIPGMRGGWYFRDRDRKILHRSTKDSEPFVLGAVPRVTATVLHLSDDGETIRIEYQIIGKRQRRRRIITEDELDRGTWAAKVGQGRPSSSDAKQAFATIMRMDAEEAPEVMARPHYSETGDLILPDAEAQSFGYRVTAGTEEDARLTWDEIGAYAILDPKAALTLGAMFLGPAYHSLDVHAHILNLVGAGQQGKSTMLTVACALLGDISPRRQQIMGTWNSSKQGITQGMRARGFLPFGLDEHSTSGRKVQEAGREFSQMVGGAVRQMGTADGGPREIDGFWWSILLSTSNQWLRWQGQTEDLASRLYEIEGPFFPHAWVNSAGDPAEPGSGAAEHVSKRLKRLARGAGGWPLEWAVRGGVFKAGNLRALKTAHLELCAKHSPRGGGIADTIAEIHMAWVVGALLLEKVLDVPGLGAAAERAAVELLGGAVTQAAEANLPEGERLWLALDSFRIEASAFPVMDKVRVTAEEGFRALRGFIDPEAGEWWVNLPTVQQAAKAAEVDNLSAALRHLDSLGVHIRGTGKNAQRKLPQSLRAAGLGERMHCFNTVRAAEVFASDDESDGTPGRPGATQFPSGATPQGDPGATQVAPGNVPLTCGGATGATGATLLELELTYTGGATPGEDAEAPADDVVASRRHDVTYPEPEERVTDPGWSRLTAWAGGIGVLGDGELHLPNRAPVAVPLPGSVDDVPELMAAYGLRTLYLHASALDVLGLPADRAARAALATAQEEEADADGQPVEPRDRRRRIVGPQEPVPHEWITPGADSVVEEVLPGGLVAWAVLKLRDGERLNLAVPAYESRIRTGADLGGLGGAPDAATLLDTLMVFTLSTVHGASDRAIPYFKNPNKTAVAFAEAGRIAEEEVLCEAIRHGEVPPALRGVVPTIVNTGWSRMPTEEERGRTTVHKFDKSAAWLGSYSGVRLGIGEPEHAVHGRSFDKMHPGYWRVAEIPGRGSELLPDLQIAEAEEGGYWLRTPGLELLTEVYPGWEPRVIEAWWWPRQKRALNAMYTKLYASRLHILRAVEEGRPGGVWAKHVNGTLYKSFRGYLDRRDPQRDFETGDLYSGDVFWRPDWAQHLLDLAVANTYRNLLKFSAAGHQPMSLYVDAITLASNETDPMLAKPGPMEIKPIGGGWSVEGSSPMGLLLPHLESAPHLGIHHVMRLHRNGEI